MIVCDDAVYVMPSVYIRLVYIMINIVLSTFYLFFILSSCTKDKFPLV